MQMTGGVAPRWGRTFMLVGLLAAALHPGLLEAQDEAPDTARERVARAMALMGGEARLRALETVRFDFMTQWQQTGFRALPATDRPSFERHVDVRDYRIPAWRNTREFGARSIVNVVRDSVATTDLGRGAQPLSIAYVDERRELFLYTPDRLLVGLADARDLHSAPDTVLAGELHHRVRATVDGFEVEVMLQEASGAPVLLRFAASHGNDFGLVPWGTMDVDVWYAGWRDFGEISIPTQWDVHRVGVPYRRMTVRDAVFGLEIAADSFHVSPELRAAYLATATRPMHESRPLRPFEIAADGLAEGGGFGYPLGAVPTSEGWVVIGAGQAEFNLESALSSLESAGVEPVIGVVAAVAATGNGGVVAAARRGLPIWTSGSARPYLERMLHAAGVSGDLRTVSGDTEVGAGELRLHLAPFSLPDAPESLIAWHPSSGWLYAPDVTRAFGQRVVRDAAEARGWSVRNLGTRRAFRSDGEAR